jgi:large subunit ribosomal protein L4
MTMDAKIYTHEGTQKGSIALSPAVFGVAWNENLVHEVVVGMQGNARAGTAHTKTRGEVRGGGKKPWKQKGTGRARHGSRRSPIWVGGGVAHGPRNEKDYTVKINKKVRQKALAIVLSKKLADNEIVFVESLSLSSPKAKDGKAVMAALAKGTGESALVTKRKNAALVLLPERNEAVELSFRNFGNYDVMQAKDVSPVDLLTYKYVVVTEPTAAVAQFAKRVGVSDATQK